MQGRQLVTCLLSCVWVSCQPVVGCGLQCGAPLERLLVGLVWGVCRLTAGMIPAGILHLGWKVVCLSTCWHYMSGAMMMMMSLRVMGAVHSVL
jgi:hypothetical protein